ncbi:GNAT family N-acetyltransferase [Flavobacterium sp. NKUCC04_CG]|uniref:GNAT family N-acetyltransferase n=1 Tax=Flavobacterium sp. NKUCC04_CG TaxID=2842121 RepID=UPI001C5A9005|nr:GNAT family N-acetyltransferase [Flavobacterium sp. NKUCC04_CG]MBW3518085.1 GNAT family N-acetyltransferase [Flavobacterium sp. NKUCC04_CG]
MEIKILSANHKRKEFSCGEALLDRYLKNQVNQDIKKSLSTCTVIVNENDLVLGYYTLSSSSVDKDSLPENLSKKFPPSYVDLPCILLGRLAVDENFKREGIGSLLLLDALNKYLNISKEIGILCVVVDPINEKAIAFYKHYGFIYLPTSGKMMISIKTIESL